MTTGSHANRREALRCGAAGALALSAVPLLRPAVALAQATDDEDLRDYLEEAIALEEVAVFAYTRAAERGQGGNAGQGAEPELARTLARFRDHEEAQATAWREAIDQLGFDAPREPQSADDAEAFDALNDARANELTDLMAGVERAGSREEVVEALIAIEEEQLRFYLDAAPALDSEDLATTSAEVAGCSAQHLVVLREQRGDTLAEAAAVA
jgi:rubrerythrin